MSLLFSQPEGKGNAKNTMPDPCPGGAALTSIWQFLENMNRK
jgi:hypothetical protein